MRRRRPRIDSLALGAIARRSLHAHEDMSAAPFAHLPELLAEFGVDCNDVLRHVGIGPVPLGDPYARLDFEQVGRLAVACEDATGCPHIGLLLGHRAGTSAAGLAGEFLRHAETVGQALRMFMAHLHIHDRGATAVLWPMTPRRVRMAYVIYHPETPGAAHIADGGLAVLYAILRHLCGPSWSPTAVLLPRRRPADIAPYRVAFRAPLRFDAPVAAVEFPAVDLERRLAGASEDEHRRLASLLASSEAANPTSTTDLVLRTLARMVPAMHPSGERVAIAVGMPRRRLHERLAAEGTRYSDLLADVRCEIARQLLEGTRLPAGDIAATLHYSSPGAFSRAFKEWTGKTPRSVRAAAGRHQRGLA